VIMMDPDPEYRIPAAAREELEKIIKEDLEYATVSSASVHILGWLRVPAQRRLGWVAPAA